MAGQKGDKEPKGKQGGQPSAPKVPPSEEKAEPIKIVPPPEVIDAGSTSKGAATSQEAKTKKNKSEGALNNSATTKETKESAKTAEAKAKKKDDESFGEKITDLRQFLKEVAIEFRKISWPEGQQVARETWSVLFLVAIITLMVLGFDWVLQNSIFGPLEHWARLHGGGIGK